MSSNLPPLHVAEVIDPRLEFRPKEYSVIKSAAISTYVTFNSTGAPTTTQVTVQCNPPSKRAAISRLVYQRAQFTCTITGTNTSGGPLLQEGRFAPRAMPITMISQAGQMTIGNNTVTQSPISAYWGALMWLGNNDHYSRFGSLSLTASMLDQRQEYSQSFQTNRSPLAPYGDNSYENTRGGFVGMEVLSNPVGGTSAVVRITSVEPILVSPFVFGSNANYYSCLSGIDNMTWQLNFGQIDRVMSIDNSAVNINIQNVNTNIDNYSLTFQYLTTIEPIPRSIQASYFNIVSYPTQFGLIQAGATQNIQFNNIQVSSIPRRLIIFCRERSSEMDFSTSDTFLALPRYQKPIEMIWDTSNFLASATTENLYDMAVKNGCTMSYTQWTDNVGSIIVLDAGIDFGLPPGLSPGMLLNINVQISCDFVNTSPRDKIVDAFCVAVYEGVFNINEGVTSVIQSPITVQDIVNAQRVSGVTYKQQKDVYGGYGGGDGGNLFTTLRNAFGTANKFLRDNKVISTALGAFPDPRVQAASKLARTLGYGRSGGRGPSGGSLNINENEINDDEYREVKVDDNGIEIEDDDIIGGNLNFNENKDEVESKNILNKIKNKISAKNTKRKVLKASDFADDY